jgi:hypothetical protein
VPTVGGILINVDKVFVIHAKSCNKWLFPKVHVKPDDDMVERAKDSFKPYLDITLGEPDSVWQIKSATYYVWMVDNLEELKSIDRVLQMPCNRDVKAFCNLVKK